MRFLCLDFESTGLDVSTARIIEAGWVLWDAENQTPLLLGSSLVRQADVKVDDEITKITKISQDMLKQFGRLFEPVIRELEQIVMFHKPEYLVGHNINSYDRPLLLAELQRNGIEAEGLKSLPILDTRTDLPHETEPDSKKLKYMAAEHDFINPFSHRAVFDCLTTLRILSHYPIEKVIALSREPWVVLRALVGYDDREKAKKRKFLWEVCGDKKFNKMWVKRVRASQLETERKAADFEIGVIQDG